jgi:CBS domain containing-hemolysin-like protein
MKNYNVNIDGYIGLIVSSILVISSLKTSKEMMELLVGKIPNEEDKYECGRFTFEIIDIDGHQIDKVLVSDSGPEITEE